MNSFLGGNNSRLKKWPWRNGWSWKCELCSVRWPATLPLLAMKPGWRGPVALIQSIKSFFRSFFPRKPLNQTWRFILRLISRVGRKRVVKRLIQVSKASGIKILFQRSLRVLSVAVLLSCIRFLWSVNTLICRPKRIPLNSFKVSTILNSYFSVTV